MDTRVTYQVRLVANDDTRVTSWGSVRHCLEHIKYMINAAGATEVTRKGRTFFIHGVPGTYYYRIEPRYEASYY
jgi:hypothetical protein